MERKNKYGELTALIPALREDSFGNPGDGEEWGDGSPERPQHFPYVRYSNTVNDLIQALYKVSETYPELETVNYRSTLDSLGIEWSTASMEKADVSSMDEKGVTALLTASVRADRFCEGALSSSLKAAASSVGSSG